MLVDARESIYYAPSMPRKSQRAVLLPRDENISVFCAIMSMCTPGMIYTRLCAGALIRRDQIVDR